MANGKKKNNYKKGGNKKRYSNSKKNRREVLSFAYKMGCVQRGLSNPESQITASYNSGLEYKKREKKSLY